MFDYARLTSEKMYLSDKPEHIHGYFIDAPLRKHAYLWQNTAHMSDRWGIASSVGSDLRGV